MGLVKDFLKWLKTPDEEEIVNGEINIKAFDGENKDTIEALKRSNKEIDEMGRNLFKENRAKYKNSIKAQELNHVDERESELENKVKVQKSNKKQESRVPEERE